MAGSEVPDVVAAGRRIVRRVLHSFEALRSDEPPYRSEWHFEVAVHEDDLDGGFVAEVTGMAGCYGQGDTAEAAIDDAVDAFAAVMKCRLAEQLEDDPIEPNEPVSVAL